MPTQIANAYALAKPEKSLIWAIFLFLFAYIIFL